MGYKAKTFFALPLELSKIKADQMDALGVSLEVAAKSGVGEFSAFSVRETTTHPPMRSVVRVTKGGGTVQLWVATKRPLLEYVQVDPGLSEDTTGRNRRLVKVTGWRGRVIAVEKGFIWNGKVYRRNRSNRWFSAATRYLAARGALPSPAEILADCAQSVADAVVGGVNVD